MKGCSARGRGRMICTSSTSIVRRILWNVTPPSIDAYDYDAARYFLGSLFCIPVWVVYTREAGSSWLPTQN